MYKKIYVLCQQAVDITTRKNVYKQLQTIFPEAQIKVPTIQSGKFDRSEADLMLVVSQNNQSLNVLTGTIPFLVKLSVNEERKHVGHLYVYENSLRLISVKVIDDDIVYSPLNMQLTVTSKCTLENHFNSFMSESTPDTAETAVKALWYSAVTSGLLSKSFTGEPTTRYADTNLCSETPVEAKPENKETEDKILFNVYDGSVFLFDKRLMLLFK